VADLIERYNNISDEVPITEEEAKEVCDDVGIDSDKSLKKLQDKIRMCCANCEHLSPEKECLKKMCCTGWEQKGNRKKST
jgi:hypothetical protein